MICKIKHFHKANKTTKPKNLNKKSFQRKKSANKYENLIKNVTKQAEARRAKTKGVDVHCAVSCNWSWFRFTICLQSKSLHGGDWFGSMCSSSKDKQNPWSLRNHFNVNPSLCVLRLSLLRLIARSIYLRMDIDRTWNFIFVAVGKNFSFLSSNKEGIKCDLFPLELKPVLKKPPAYAEEPPDYSGHVFSPGPRA